MILIRVTAIERKDLAAKMRVRPTHLSRALKTSRGAHGPPASIIDKLCDALDCQPGDFLEHVPEE